MIKRTPAYTSTKTYFFVKTADGAQYLQAQLNSRCTEWSFWLADKKGWTPCCPDRASAEQYVRAAEAKVGPLTIVEETL